MKNNSTTETETEESEESEETEETEESEESEEIIKDFQYKDYELYDNGLTNDLEYWALAKDIKAIKKLIEQIIKSEGMLFNINENAKGGKTIECKIPNIFKDLKEYARPECITDIELRFPMHRLNPYIKLYIKNMTADNKSVQGAFRIISYGKPYNDNELTICVDVLNAFIDNIRSEGKSQEFKKALNNYQHPFNKNYKSLRRFHQGAIR